MIADPMNEAEGKGDMTARANAMGCTVCPVDVVFSNPEGFEALLKAVLALPKGGFLSPGQVKAILKGK